MLACIRCTVWTCSKILFDFPVVVLQEGGPIWVIVTLMRGTLVLFMIAFVGVLDTHPEGEKRLAICPWGPATYTPRLTSTVHACVV